MKNIIMTIMVVLLTAVTAHAELDSATYFEIEINARSLTISGMEERLVCMQDSNCPESRAFELDEESQATIMSMYGEYNTTPSRVAAYYTQNNKEVEEYLRIHLSVQLTLNQLTSEFETLSSSIRTFLEQ